MDRVNAAQYYHAKQACYLCHNNHDVVDTSIIIEGEGVLCICRNCIGDMAHTAGFALSDREQELADLKVELEESETARNEAEGMVLSLGSYVEKVKNLAKAREAKKAKVLA
jgi:hypothetical protein